MNNNIKKMNTINRINLLSSRDPVVNANIINKLKRRLRQLEA